MILFSVIFSPVNLNWQKLPQFLRKALGKTKITTGQYKFYPFLVKCLKRLYMCISASMVILNLVTFFIHSNLALGKSARQIMHWYKLLNQSITGLKTMSLGVAFLLIWKRHLIQLIIPFFYQSWIIMEWEVKPMTGFNHICPIENNLYV